MTATIMTRWWEKVEEAYCNQQIFKCFGMCTSYVLYLNSHTIKVIKKYQKTEKYPQHFVTFKHYVGV